MRRWIRRAAAPILAAAFAVALVMPASATIIDVAGTVPKTGSWVDYTTLRCTTYNNSPKAQVNVWNGSTIYLAARTTGGVRVQQVTYTQGDSTWRQLAFFGTGTCFYMSAHRDASIDFWNWSSWAGKLNY